MDEYEMKKERIAERFQLTLQTQLNPMCVNKILSEGSRNLQQQASHVSQQFHDLDVSLLHLLLTISETTPSDQLDHCISSVFSSFHSNHDDLISKLALNEQSHPSQAQFNQLLIKCVQGNSDKLANCIKSFLQKADVGSENEKVVN